MATPDSTVTPGVPRRVELSFPSTPNASAQMRRALGDLALPLPLEGDAQLLAAELVTNSVSHSGPAELVHVTIQWSGERLRVTVRDRTPTAELPVSAAIRPGPGAEAGWGLYLVDRLSDRWGTGPNGYWFELNVSQYRRER